MCNSWEKKYEVDTSLPSMSLYNQYNPQSTIIPLNLFLLNTAHYSSWKHPSTFFSCFFATFFFFSSEKSLLSHPFEVGNFVVVVVMKTRQLTVQASRRNFLFCFQLFQVKQWYQSSFVSADFKSKQEVLL